MQLAMVRGRTRQAFGYEWWGILEMGCNGSSGAAVGENAWYDTNMGPVENITVGYLLPKDRSHVGSAFSICSTKGCPGADTMKSLLNPTGFVCAPQVEGVALVLLGLKNATVYLRIAQSRAQRIYHDSEAGDDHDLDAKALWGFQLLT